MNKFRYIDKKVLCSYDLSEEFFEKLGVNVYDIIPLRKVFVLFTDKGKKILKSTNSTNERIKFISNALDIIRETDQCVLQYCNNSQGEKITRWRGTGYVLLDLIEGREANFTNPIEVEWCTKALANFHRASIGIVDKLDSIEIEENKGKNLIYEQLNNLCIINEIERVVNKFNYKNEFDLLFLENVAKAKNDLNVSINLLTKSSYIDLYKDDNSKVLCHLDLAHHNFIINDEIVNLIDFDYCNINLKIIDLYNFMSKVIKNIAYDKEMLDNILKTYNSINEISDEEIQVLYALLNYPRDFVDITIDYYLKQKSWDEEVFISRFKDKIENNIFKSELLLKLGKI